MNVHVKKNPKYNAILKHYVYSMSTQNTSMSGRRMVYVKKGYCLSSDYYFNIIFNVETTRKKSPIMPKLFLKAI